MRTFISMLVQVLIRLGTPTQLSQYEIKGMNLLVNCNPSQRGCCIMSALATQLLHIILFHDDIMQLDLKKFSPWYTCDTSLHRVSAISVHYFWRYEHFSERHFYFSWSDFVAFSRNLCTIQIPYNNITILILGFMVLKPTSLNPVFQSRNRFWKIFTES